MTKDELSEAIAKSSSKSAPGNDKISFLIIKKAFQYISDTFEKLYSRLIQIDYHLYYLKTSN